MKQKNMLILGLFLLVLIPIVTAPQPYPDPNFNTTEGLVKYSNEVTDGWITILFMIASAVIIFSMCHMKNYRTSDSFLVAFFITTVLGSFFWAAGVLPGKIMVIYLFLTISSAIYSVLKS